MTEVKIDIKCARIARVTVKKLFHLNTFLGGYKVFTF